MAAVLLTSERRWECPNCTETAVARVRTAGVGGGGTQMHLCRGLRGLLAPMVPAGTKCKIEARDREDYVGSEIVTTDATGRPVMSIVTTRDNGQDCVVFAPCARGRVEI